MTGNEDEEQMQMKKKNEQKARKGEWALKEWSGTNQQRQKQQ